MALFDIFQTTHPVVPKVGGFAMNDIDRATFAVLERFNQSRGGTKGNSQLSLPQIFGNVKNSTSVLF